MDWIEVIGWAGSLLTFTAYSMKTMLPLRIVAVCANLCFLTYGYSAEVWQMAVLHAALLPFNGWRLSEILILRARMVQQHRSGLPDFSLLKAYGTRISFDRDETIFVRGGAPDKMYYIEHGEVLIEELGITLGPGDIFGEIAFFTEARERTATARAAVDCCLRAVDDRIFLKLYYQDPMFGIAIMKTITRRLIDGMARRPEVYQSETDRRAAE